jgi:hypothetical protein
MDAARFHASLAGDLPPDELGTLGQALWYDGRGSWDRAHELVQSVPGPQAAAIHAYLHRKEGDSANADYWYARAGVKRPDDGLQMEWRRLVDAVLRLESALPPATKP